MESDKKIVQKESELNEEKKGLSTSMIELHSGDGDTVPSPESGGGDCKELFLKSMARKTGVNIYSTSSRPLKTPWTFWVDRTQRGMGVEQFEASLRRIHMVYSVHVFWGVYYNIPAPSSLDRRSSLHLSRDARKPMWEEEYNCKGGTFRLRVNKKDTDKVWRELLMAAVGEQLNEYVSKDDEICGVSVSVRDREDLLLIWNKYASEAGKARVFDCVHLLLPDTTFLSEFYKPHVTHHAFEKQKAVKVEKGESVAVTASASVSTNTVHSESSSGGECNLSE